MFTNSESVTQQNILNFESMPAVTARNLLVEHGVYLSENAKRVFAFWLSFEMSALYDFNIALTSSNEKPIFECIAENLEMEINDVIDSVTELFSFRWLSRSNDGADMLYCSIPFELWPTQEAAASFKESKNEVPN